MSNPANSNSTSRLTSEDIVIIVVMAFGFLGGLAILKLNYQPIIVSVLFGTGIASLIYRFLGGIENTTTITLGPVKLVGALAALIGAAWIINMKLEEQTGMGPKLSIQPAPHSWFGMGTKGNPVTVKIMEDSIAPPDNGLTANRLIMKSGKEQIKVFGAQNPKFQLGFLGKSDFEDFGEDGLFNKFPKYMQNFVTTDELHPDDSPVSFKRDNLPFKLNVTSFGGGNSYYQLLSLTDNSVLHEGKINTRGAEIVKLLSRHFIVSVFSVNHQRKEKKQYARFMVGELSPVLSFE